MMTVVLEIKEEIRRKSQNYKKQGLLKVDI